MDDDKKTVVSEVESNGGQIEKAEEAPAQVPSAETTTGESDQLPDNSSERTRLEFEKLKAHNRDLADKLKSYESSKEYGNVFDSVYGGQGRQPTSVPQVPTGQQGYVAPSFVDESGYVDPAVLQRSLQEANSRAERAEILARQANESQRLQEEKRQVREAHEKFSWLNPADRDNFDQVGFDLVRDRLVRNMWEGKEQSLAEVAQSVAGFRTPTAKSDELKEQAVAEYKEKQSVRAQASSVQSGKGQPRDDATKIDDLRRRTSMGDDSALDERLRNI